MRTRETKVRRSDPTSVILGGSAVALGAAFWGMVRLGDLFDRARGFVLLFVLASCAYALAVAWVVRRPPARRADLLAILGAAIAFRLILLPTAPTLSTDVYRYLWDGRLAVSGVSPYRYPASAPEIAALRDATVYPHLNHAEWRTVYPPGAQLLFAAVARMAPASPLAFKAVMVAFDLLALALLVGWLQEIGRPPAWSLVYAWHPLVIVEFAGSGHLDAVVLALSVGALWAATRGREGWAGALVGAGGLVKLYPILLLAAVARRRPIRALAAGAAVMIAGYGLYAHLGRDVLGSLARYVADEEFNGGARAVLEWALAPIGPSSRYAARLIPLAGLAVFTLGVGALARSRPPWRRAVWLVGGYLLTTPNLFPWYALWIVPIVAAIPAWPWLYLSCAVGLTYLILAEPVWHIPTWVTAAQFAPVLAGLALSSWRRRGARSWPAAALGIRPSSLPGAPARR